MRKTHNQPADDKKLIVTTHRFDSCEPQMFRAGDIVQAQVSFVVIPIKGGKRKMLSVLRSVAHLDGRFANVSNLIHYQKQTRTDKPLEHPW